MAGALKQNTAGGLTLNNGINIKPAAGSTKQGLQPGGVNQGEGKGGGIASSSKINAAIIADYAAG